MKKRSYQHIARVLAVLAATSALSGIPAHAADAADASADMAAADLEAGGGSSTIVVTGQVEHSTQLASEAIDFGNNVQIVNAQDIEASGASNFAELAQFLIKGANVGYSPDEGEYTIRLDGGGDRDTLVVLDGVPLYDRGPALETIWGATTIDPHMIDHVEVFRGGNSLFFGSNGGIGVVSVITKKPDGEKHFEFGASYGSFNSRELWGNATIPLDAEGRHSVMIYGSSQNTDGPRIFNPSDYVDNVAAGGGIQLFPLTRDNVGIKYLWKVDDKTEFRVNGQYTQIIFQDSFPSNTVYSPNRVQYPIVDMSLTRRWSDKLNTEFYGYWSNPTLRNTEMYPEVCQVQAGCPDPQDPSKITPWGKWTGKNVPWANKGFGDASKVGGFQEFGLNLRNTLTLPGVLELVAGVQRVSYKNDSDPVFPIGNESETITGVYGDFRPVLPFSPKTKISLALRTDFSKSFGSKTIWKVGFRQPIGDTFYIRANGGTSYSAPQTNELYRQSETVIGNPDLKNEETKTYNAAAGFNHMSGNVQFGGEVGYFHTDITNRIRTTSGLTPNTYYNDPAVNKIRGVTADLNLNVGKELAFNLSFTKQDAKAAGSDLQINETPEYMIQGQASYHSPDGRWHVSLFPRYQGPEWASGGPGRSLRHNFGNYFVMNGSIGFWAGEEHKHRFQLRVVNIFDEYYAERYGYGNMLYSEAYVTGQITKNSPEYYYGYPFEGKPRSFFVSYSTKF